MVCIADSILFIENNNISKILSAAFRQHLFNYAI